MFVHTQNNYTAVIQKWSVGSRNIVKLQEMFDPDTSI